MTARRWLPFAAALVLVTLLIIAVTWGLERLFAPPSVPAEQPPAPAAQSSIPHITATLYYAAADAQALVGVRREVPLAPTSIEQGRRILEAQVAAAPDGLSSPIPAGVSVRGFYVTPQGDAFVDLSPEVTANHPGGTATERLTVAAIVNAVTANLPAVRRVQILVDGKEVDTLAGHLDLRRPLSRDTSLIREGDAPEP